MIFRLQCSFTCGEVLPSKRETRHDRLPDFHPRSFRRPGGSRADRREHRFGSHLPPAARVIAMIAAQYAIAIGLLTITAGLAGVLLSLLRIVGVL